MLSTFCILIAYYCGTGIVWEAWGITFAIVFALTLYACKTKTDFSFKRRLHSIFFSWCYLHIITKYDDVSNNVMYMAKCLFIYLSMFLIYYIIWILFNLGNLINNGKRSNNIIIYLIET